MFFCITLIGPLNGRSIHRPHNPDMPCITTKWVDDTATFKLKSLHLEAHPYLLFDQQYFNDHFLPQNISYRYNPKESVSREQLGILLENLLEEVQQKKKHFTHFTILCDSNFNRKRIIGLLILKCKNYPFVVKLFIENPQDLISPFHKGLEPMFCFLMGGGMNRHLCGFSRVSNAENIKKLLAETKWAPKIDLPRKWFWIPKNCRWIEVCGTNLGPDKYIKTKIPGTYCVVADAIEIDRIMTFFKKTDRKSSLELCNLLRFSLDPNVHNFMIEKNTGKIVIIDTEHFPSLMGITQFDHVYNYESTWYLHLARKYVENVYLHTKKERKIKSRKPFRKPL